MMSKNLSAATVCLLVFSLLAASCAEKAVQTPPQGLREREARVDVYKDGWRGLSSQAIHKRALKTQKEGRLAEARDYFKKLSSEGYILEDYAALGFAEAGIATGNVDGVLSALDDALERNPDSPIREKMDSARLRIACADEATELCVTYIGIIRKGKVSQDFEPELLYVATRRKEKARETLDAYKEYQRIYFSYPASTSAEKAEASMRMIEKENTESGSTLKLPKPSLNQKMERVEKLEAARRFDLASAELSTMAKDAPRHEAPRLLYRLGMALKKTRDKDGARKAFEKLLKMGGGGPYAGMAAYQMALIEWNEDRDKEAEKRLLKTVKGKYGVEARRVSNILLGKIYESRKEYKSAQSHYRKALSLKPSPTESTEIEWRVGWMEYQTGNHKKAGSLFMEAHQRAPESERDGGFLYWSARAFQKAGDEKRAQKAIEPLTRDFPDTYYGSKMSGDSHVLTAVPASFTLSKDVFPAEPVLDERAERLLKRYRALTDLDEKESARLEAAQIAGALNDNYDSLIWLSTLYGKANDAPSSIKTAWRAMTKLDEGRKKDYAETGWKALYPALHWDAVSRESEERGLDPFLALSIIRQESMFDPKAVSVANARGLMQLLPSTAKMTNDALVKNGASGADFQENALFEPETNIRLGVAHFSTLVGKYGGNLVRSIAAYNAGAAPVEKWMERFGGADDDEFVEMIPYLETKNYVKKVLRNMALYRRIYGSAKTPENGSTAMLEGAGR